MQEFLTKHRLPEHYQTLAQCYFNPLLDKIAQKQNQLHRTFFVGINGCQGSGKSTLADYLVWQLRQKYQLTCAVFSLDDFYFSRLQRAQMASDLHPLFKVRGVPGTHDTGAMEQAFLDLQQPGEISLPRFNKADDNPFPPTQWPRINTPVDIVIMEGWCWGVPPQPEKDLLQPVNELEAIEDPEAIWRKLVNEFIKERYVKVYDIMDFWVMLKAPSFAVVANWRKEQEHKLIASLATSSDPVHSQNVMSDAEIDHFISHYQRLTEYELKVMPSICNCVFELDHDRNIVVKHSK